MYIHVFVVLAIAGGEWSASRPGRSCPGDSPRYAWDRQLGGRQRWPWRQGERQFFTLPGVELRRSPCFCPRRDTGRARVRNATAEDIRDFLQLRNFDILFSTVVSSPGVSRSPRNLQQTAGYRSIALRSYRKVLHSNLGRTSST
jgi:hypothetical protein